MYQRGGGGDGGGEDTPRCKISSIKEHPRPARPLSRALTIYEGETAAARISLSRERERERGVRTGSLCPLRARVSLCEKERERGSVGFSKEFCVLRFY